MKFQNLIDSKPNFNVHLLNGLIIKNTNPRLHFFVYNNYSPVGERMYFTEENAIKIDGIRIDMEELYKDNILEYNEYSFLLASLLESVTKVSNTSGTYQAYFKFWESRSSKLLVLRPLEMTETLSVNKNNIVYNKNTNQLVREISGDIAYIDPPYTTTQYVNSYHVLETIAKYDYPEVFGITGRRKKREFSGYSNNKLALYEFEDLFRQIDFEHILVSYSNQSIVPIEEIIELARKFAVDNIVHVESNEYREYSTNNLSYKRKGNKLKEYIIYFRKNRGNIKSPLNYSGSKDVLLPSIFKELPKHVGTFVDMMGGAFNVGANVFAIDKVIYNEFNPFIFDIIDMLLSNDKVSLVKEIQETVNQYSLEKKNKENYINFRNIYNNLKKTPLNLFILQMYSFQNIIRFNSKHQMNTPTGNNEFNEGSIQRIKNFNVKSTSFELINGNYLDLDPTMYPKDTIFYFDPPYFITNSEYIDGKRGMNGWDSNQETELLQYISKLNDLGYKFMLSNVLEHRGKMNNILIEWIDTHDFEVVDIGRTGIKFPRYEVLIKNFD